MHDDILLTKDCGACDRHAAENGVSGERLMDAAGRAVAAAIRRRWAPRPALVLCGPGNNGGDGFVCAAALREAGWPVRVALLGERDRLSGDAAWAAARWDGPVEAATVDGLAGAGLVVDAIFGAGLNRPPEGLAADLIAAMAQTACPVIAVDLPSGIDGDRAAAGGAVAPVALTVTFHRRKPAHMLEPAASLCGEIVLADIGIPASWRRAVAPCAVENRPDQWYPVLPEARAGDHKHARGRLAVFTGGASSTGAARLAARAGLRAGAGLVTLVSPPGALMVNATASTAVMVRRWPGPAETADLLGELRAEVAVMGPAMGVGEATREAVLSALAHPGALVLDADALTSFEQARDALFAALRPGDVLTPHPGEFRRLFPDLDDASAGNRIGQARRASERAGCTVLLKGPDTVIAAPGRVPAVNRHASPALATAGSGDVLAGLIGGLAAQGVDGFDAACAAAWLHGDAALHLGGGLIAEDLTEALTARLQALHREQHRGRALGHLLLHES
ncbi:MAG: NAD(P)H-hydrate dehydratase [Pseudomonadota bacterium]|nr:NAD(P)H-hydrate dehydratase [Pseudomonadota bacterium]